MRWLCILVWLASPAWGQTIAVESGEHEGYSRLVLPLPEGAEWQMGRSAGGYELALTGNDLRFDVSRVFDLIPKTRLTGIFADPVTGHLRMAISCLCHALPFQLDARTLVIDLRDGPAPPGSSFELALDGSKPAPLLAAVSQRPRARPAVSDEGGQGYDWLALPKPPAVSVPGPDATTGPMGARNPDFGPLRETLIRQLSRGAADGVIQLALPEAHGDAPPAPTAAQMRVTTLPGSAVHGERSPAGALQPDGVPCLSDIALDLAAWGDDSDVATQIAKRRQALVGEFDKPDQAVVAAFVRLQLYLGFGAEAEQTIAAFSVSDADVGAWISLARIMDGRTPGENSFAGMAGCDTAASLWAVLSAADDVPIGDFNVAAVKRAFSALPAHLRLQLAPKLSERALAIGQDELAFSVTQAARRSATITDAGAEALLQARMDMADGHLAEVSTAMEALLAAGGPSSAEALILLVDARVALAEPLAPEIPDVAAAMLREHAGTELEPDLRQAWHLSMAAAGDFDAVFAAAPNTASMPEVWRLLAHVGTDDAVLAYGILSTGAPMVADHDASTLLAERLLGMGFAEAADRWMSTVEGEPLLRARIDLARGDGRAVLSTLAGQTSPEALALKAQAEMALGQPDLARVTFAVAGDQAASLRAAGWAQHWGEVSQGPEGAWQAAAKTVTKVPASVTGPLAQGQALIADSAAMRASLDVLLASVPQP
jgi:hypothetical protein